MNNFGWKEVRKELPEIKQGITDVLIRRVHSGTSVAEIARYNPHTKDFYVPDFNFTYFHSRNYSTGTDTNIFTHWSYIPEPN